MCQNWQSVFFYRKIVKGGEINISFKEYFSDTDSFENTPCPLCGSESSSLLYEINSYKYNKCNNCELVYLNPRLKEESLLNTMHKTVSMRNIARDRLWDTGKSIAQYFLQVYERIAQKKCNRRKTSGNWMRLWFFAGWGKKLFWL